MTDLYGISLGYAVSVKSVRLLWPLLITKTVALLPLMGMGMVEKDLLLFFTMWVNGWYMQQLCTLNVKKHSLNKELQPSSSVYLEIDKLRWMCIIQSRLRMSWVSLDKALEDLHLTPGLTFWSRCHFCTLYKVILDTLSKKKLKII